MHEAIFAFQNLNPKGIIRVKISNNILGYVSSSHTKKVSNSQPTLRFSSSNFVSGNKRKTATIAIFSPKETPSSFVNGMSDKIRNVLSNKSVKSDKH